jgi:undecaprenyl-diphosphatase
MLSGREWSRSWAVVALSCAVVVTTLALLVVCRWHPLISADTRAVNSAHATFLSHHWLQQVTKAVTHLGAPIVVTAIAVVAAVAAATRRRWDLVVLIAAVRLLELGANGLAKALVDRPRPQTTGPVVHAVGASFPSGHAAGAAAIYGLMALLLMRGERRGLRVVLIAAAVVVVVAVAASRVLLGVHYPSDVTAGVFLGLGSLAIVRTVLAAK